MEFRMKIFVSWSGKRSKAVAELMSDWLKCVIQASQPWISTRDIDRGAIWFSGIKGVRSKLNTRLKKILLNHSFICQESQEFQS
jgi:hypothetical protein